MRVKLELVGGVVARFAAVTSPLRTEIVLLREEGGGDSLIFAPERGGNSCGRLASGFPGSPDGSIAPPPILAGPGFSRGSP